MAIDNASVSILKSSLATDLVALTPNENRKMASLYNDPFNGGADVCVISLGDQLATATRTISFNLYPGDFYELPLVADGNGGVRCYNGMVRVLWRTATGGQLTITDIT